MCYYINYFYQSAATGQLVQQRTATPPTEMVTIATSPGVRAVTAGTVVSTNLTPIQTQARTIVTQVTTGSILHAFLYLITNCCLPSIPSNSFVIFSSHLYHWRSNSRKNHNPSSVSAASTTGYYPGASTSNAGPSTIPRANKGRC